MRYKHTDRKQFVEQLARIERRQARIRRIHSQKPSSQHGSKEYAIRPEAHHVIGKTENSPEHLGLFVQKHSGDPAIGVHSRHSSKFFCEA